MLPRQSLPFSLGGQNTIVPPEPFIMSPDHLAMPVNITAYLAYSLPESLR